MCQSYKLLRIFLIKGLALLGFVVFLSQAASAQVSNVEITVQVPSLEVVSNLNFSLYGDSGQTLLGVGVINNGTATVPEAFTSTTNNFIGKFPIGTYKLVLEPSSSYAIPDNGKFLDKEAFFTVAKIDNQGEGSILKLPPYVLDQATRWMKFTVKEGTTPLIGKDLPGEIIPGYYLAVIKRGPPYTQFIVKTNTVGDAYVNVPLADDYYDVCAPADPTIDHIYHCTEIDFLIVSSDPGRVETVYDVLVRSAKAQVTVALKDAVTGKAFAVPDNLTNAKITCARQPDNAPWYDVGVGPGESAGILEVTGGDYNCYAWIDNFISGVSSVNVTANSNHKVSVPIYKRNSSIKLRAIDESGNLVTDAEVQFTLHADPLSKSSNNLSDIVYGATENGELTLETLSGLTYQVSAFIKPDSKDKYVAPNDILSVAAPEAGKTNIVDFILLTKDSTIKVNFSDENGIPVPSGVVKAYTRSASASSIAEYTRTLASQVQSRSNLEKELSFYGTVIDGVAEFKVKSDRELTLVGSSYKDANNNLVIGPPSQTLTLSPGEIREVSLQSERADHTLTIHPKVYSNKSEDDEVGYLSLACSAYNTSLQQSYSYAENNTSSVELPLVIGKEWEITCQGIYGQDVESAKVYFGQTIYKPTKEVDSISLTLIEGGVYLPPSNHTFDASKDATLQLADGKTEVEIPAGAFAESGTITMNVGSGVGFTYSQDNFPIFVLDFKFTDSDNNVLTSPSKAVLIRFPVNEEELLKNYGVTPDKLKVASYDPDLNIWKEDGASSYDSLTKTQTLTVNHFSIWGQLIEKAWDLKESYTPTKFRATKIGKEVKAKKKDKKTGGKNLTYMASWIAPKAATSETLYEIDLLKLNKNSGDSASGKGGSKNNKKNKKGGKKTKKKGKKSKKKVKSSDAGTAQGKEDQSYDWSKATIISDIATTIYRINLKPGKYALRVRMKDRNLNSSTFEISVE